MSEMPSAAAFAAPMPLVQHGSLDGAARPRTLHQTRIEQERALRRRLRRRAALDALLILLTTAGASLMGADSHNRLLAGLAVLSVGILLFVMRRGEDVARLVDAGRWRDEATAGRGLSIAQWHAGVPLPEWSERHSDAHCLQKSTTQMVPAGKRDRHSGERTAKTAAVKGVHPAGEAPKGPENSDSRDDAR